VKKRTSRSPRRRRTRRTRRTSRTPRTSPIVRWNPDPEDVQRSVVKLVLSLIEFIRKLMERQAIRRLDEGTLTHEEIDNVGIALMKLEETVSKIAKQFKLDPKDLNLDLGPVGRLH
jgi:Gas vesicle protein K